MVPRIRLVEPYRSLYIVVAIALTGVFALLCAVRSADAQVSPDVTGSIAGRVLDESGQGLSDIHITLFRQDKYDLSYYRYVDSSDAGAFSFDYLPTGVYRLAFRDPAGVYGRVYYPDALALQDAADIPIAGQDVTDLETTMQFAGQIEGQVRLWNGEPPKSVSVKLFQRAASGWQFVTEGYDYNDDQTATVSYHFSGLQPGEYRLKFEGTHVLIGWRTVSYTEYHDNAVSLDDATSITVDAGATVTVVDAVLGENPNQANVSGTVQSLDGTRLPDIVVTAAVSGTMWPSYSAVTDDVGAYALRALPPEQYTVRYEDESREHVSIYLGNTMEVESASVISLTAGEEMIGLNVAMTPTGKISGTIAMLDGTDPQNVIVYAYSARTSFAEEERFYLLPDFPHYELGKLMPDTYRLFFVGSSEGSRYSEFYLDAMTLEQATDVVVRPGETTGNIDVLLGENPVYAAVSGQVSTTSGSPLLSEISVTAYEENVEGGYWSYRKEIVADQDGNYRLFGLLPGRYKVGFQDNAYYGQIYHDKYYADATTLEGATPISVDEGMDVTGIDVIVEHDGIVTGSLTAVNGRPLYRPINLILFTERAEGWEEVDRKFLWLDGSSLDYFWSGLQAGLYRMGAHIESSEESIQYYPNAANIEDAANIPIALNNVTPDINFIVGDDTADARVEGIVTHIGVPQPGFHAELYWDEWQWDDWWRLVYMVTGEDGRFRIDGLEAGDYRLCAVDPAGVIERVCYWGAVNVESGLTVQLADGQIVSDLRIEMKPSVFDHIFLPIIAR